MIPATASFRVALLLVEGFQAPALGPAPDACCAAIQRRLYESPVAGPGKNFHVVSF